MTLVFDNHTAFDALQYEMLDQFNHAFHVVVCKIAYAIGPAGLRESDHSPGWATLTPLPQAALLLSEDEYFGEMLRTGVRMESDLAPFKPRCDVIVNASAYPPHAATQCQVRLIVQRPSTPAPLPEPPRGLNQHMAASEQALRAWRTEVALAQRSRIPGARLIDKTLMVYGERHLWREGNRWNLSAPQAFSQMPIRYEMALGGECRVNAGDAAAARVPAHARLSAEQLAAHPDVAAPPDLQPVAHTAYEYNLLGRGYSQAWYWQASQCQTLAAPRIEYPGQPFHAEMFSKLANNALTPDSLPAVAGLGCVGRAWLPRRQLIGQFQAKAHYAEDEYPELPQDFDFGYWNCAPRDQQCAHLLGDEEFALINLCAPDAATASINQQQDTQLRFQLPGHVFYLALEDATGRFGVKPLLIDTVTIAPDENRLEVVWRAVLSTTAQLTGAQLRFVQSPEQLAQLETMLAMQHSFAQEMNASEVPYGA